MNVLGHRVKRSRGSSPELNPPRHPLDTAPKGAETHPGDGRLSVGNASMPLSYNTMRGTRISPMLPVLLK
jgi:hypothetical protein